MPVLNAASLWALLTLPFIGSVIVATFPTNARTMGGLVAGTVSVIGVALMIVANG